MLRVPSQKPELTREAQVSGYKYNQLVHLFEIITIMLAESELDMFPTTETERDDLLDRVFDAVKAAEAEVDAEIRASA